MAIYTRGAMSFSAEIEHIYAPVEELPLTLHAVFPNGVCTVWTDAQFTAAIPASNDETNELADLMEIAATNGITPEEPAMKAYYVLRDRLCGEKGYQVLSLLFKQEMDKVRRATQLASAARLN